MVTYTSIRPVTVDGVRLDTLAYNVTKINRSMASRRSSDQEVPGYDGVLPSYNDTVEPAAYGLEMFVRGTDSDGNVPGAGSWDTFRTNLDELVHLFGKRWALLDLQEQVDSSGTLRRAYCKATDVIAPDINLIGSAATFTVGLSLVDGMWSDVATADWTSAAPTSGVAQTVTTLTGASERITDGIYVVQGPCVNPRLTDPATGAYVQLNATLAAGDYWRVNADTWATRRTVGSALTLGSADTTGTDAQAITTYGGTRNQAAFLMLTPVRASATVATRTVSLALSGTGITSATRFSSRTVRKYAA